MATTLIDPTDAPAPTAAGPDDVAESQPARDTVGRVARLTRRTGDPVVPWYDGSQIHVGERDTNVRRLVSIKEASGAVFGVQSDGTVVVIRAGGIEPLGSSRPEGDLVVSTSAPVAAWIDRTSGALTFAGTARPAPAPVPLPDGSRLVALDGQTTFVEVPDGHWVVGAGGEVRRLSVAAPLDVANGVRVERDGLRMRVSGGDGRLEVAGLEARLSDDGRYLLTRDVTSSASAFDVVVDLRRGRTVVLPLPDDGRIVDSAFGARGTLSLVLARPNGAPYPAEWPRGQSYSPGFDIVTCRLREGTCQSAVRLFDIEDPPVLAR